MLQISNARGARQDFEPEVDGVGARWPLRRIDRAGNVHEIGTLCALAADEYRVDASTDAVARGFAYMGISRGVPYFLQDQCPGGFLGRAVASRYPELDLPQRLTDWRDDHCLHYLARCGSDAVSDLILGDDALEEYWNDLRTRTAIPEALRIERYPELAQAVMQGGHPGPSVHGEQPKFAALVEQDARPRHVLVKFSPPMSTPAGQRWADLLIAEHHAHQILQGAGIAACDSRTFVFADRRYLEMDRFDRESLNGRIGVTSLSAIDAAHYGELDNWTSAAMRLSRDGRIAADTLEQVRLVSTFGALIANTDRHFGNLAFLDQYRGTFALAPIYDMLPMLFAPQGDQVMARIFVPPAPISATPEVWNHAHELAQRYWSTLAGDERIGTEFRDISAQCVDKMARLPGRGACSGADSALNAT